MDAHKQAAEKMEKFLTTEPQDYRVIAKQAGVPVGKLLGGVARFAIGLLVREGKAEEVRVVVRDGKTVEGGYPQETEQVMIYHRLKKVQEFASLHSKIQEAVTEALFSCNGYEHRKDRALAIENLLLDLAALAREVASSPNPVAVVITSFEDTTK